MYGAGGDEIALTDTMVKTSPNDLNDIPGMYENVCSKGILDGIDLFL